MLVVISLLLTWLGALALGFTMGGLIHVLAFAAVAIELARRTAHVRHA